VGFLFAQTVKTEIHAIDVIASGEVIGGTKLLPNETATVALTADSCLNIIHINNDADPIEYDLPVAERRFITSFLDDAGGAITLDPNGSEYIVVDGVSAGAGTAVVSDGTRGRYAVLIGRNGYWVMLPATGWE